jgi:hypothetical protein
LEVERLPTLAYGWNWVISLLRERLAVDICKRRIKRMEKEEKLPTV